ncbi:MAG: hypothetical protein NC201_04925 [Prevotella sp.]|nr:hypothetical protein [Bacteroides sp.]MCM1366573.1 hypothetical protein [Prevotella sp.]MCM1437242.1 hypothetical protein [Prevotella sp.]
MKRKIITVLLAAVVLALTPCGILSQTHRNQGAGNSRGNSVARPGNTTTTRPATTINNNRPGNTNVKPGNSTNSNHGSSTIRPGGNNQFNPVRPGYNTGHSAPRPGVGATPSPRPSYSYRPPVISRWERPLPPPPVRTQYVPVYRVPSISNILGLTFGTLIDYGIRSLLTSGYDVAGTYSNGIYLNNVSQFGIIWPQVTIYYGVNGMNGARFQYSSYSPGNYNFNIAFNSLCAAYGNPVGSQTLNGVTSYTWWGGNNTGYITLQYGPGVAENGSYMYYTDLIYGL